MLFRSQNVSAENGVLGAYKHGDRIAVLAVLSGKDADLAKDIAMHIAASRPECVSEEQLSNELLEREKSIFIEQAKESGKPDNIIEKMIVGRMKKFVNEVTLRSEEHTSELQSQAYLVCRLLLEKKKHHKTQPHHKLKTSN